MQKFHEQMSQPLQSRPDSDEEQLCSMLDELDSHIRETLTGPVTTLVEQWYGNFSRPLSVNNAL